MIKFSIIIPVRTFNEYLKENISYINKLDYKDFEVIIVTDEDEKHYFEDRRFRVISSGKVGPAEKRNLAAKNAEGKILAFLDDDAYPNRHWLSNAEKAFEENKNIIALGAPALTPEKAEFLELMSGKVLESFLASAGYVYRHLPGRRRYVSDYPTVNFFVRKDIFMSVGGFITDFWPGEDTKLCLDLINKYGNNILYDPSPAVYHHRRKLFKGHLKQVSRYGKHRGRFARLFPETSRLPQYFIPSIFVLGIISGAVVSMFSMTLWRLYISVMLIYTVALALESARLACQTRQAKSFPYILSGIFLTHIVYGVNFIIGFIKSPELKLRDVDKKSGNYLGG